MKMQILDIQELNIAHIALMQNALRTDPVTACYRYGIAARRAPQVVALTPEQIMVLVVGIGQQSAFQPRDTFWRYLEDRGLLPICL